MRGLVVGYGSIGRRHARLLVESGVETRVVTSQSGVPLGIGSSIGEAVARFSPELVVVATPTADHWAALQTLAEIGFFGLVVIEKPLFHHPFPLPVLPFRAVFVAYQLRFLPALRAVKKAAGADRILAAHIECGQYLPTWRPERDYRRSYSASSAQGGGALRDLSHELDLALWLFGPWRRVGALGGKRGSLDIDSDDCWGVLMEMETGALVSIQLDYYRRPGKRSMTLTGERHTVAADLGEGLVGIDGESRCFESGRDLPYREQWSAILDGRFEDCCTLSQGMAVVELIAAIERAACEGRWVTR